jgi:polyhydroxybutyrate depolymerase
MRLLGALFLACIGCTGPTPPLMHHPGLPDGGALAGRSYDVDVPDGYDKTQPHPLIVLLHGYGGDGAQIDAYFGFAALANAQQLLVARPDGTVDDAGHRFWNATDACCNYYNSYVDDVAFLNALIDDVKKKYNVDSRRVFIVGHSNGAFMAHRMACDSAARVAGIVAHAGVVWNSESACQPTAPVAVLQVHGDHDTVVPFSGTLGQPSAVRTVAIWAQKNGCTGGLQATGETLDLDVMLPGNETSVTRYNCTAGAAELWTMQGDGHDPDLRLPDWGNDVFAWLMQHPKP